MMISRRGNYVKEGTVGQMRSLLKSLFFLLKEKTFGFIPAFNSNNKVRTSHGRLLEIRKSRPLPSASFQTRWARPGGCDRCWAPGVLLLPGRC